MPEKTKSATTSNNAAEPVNETLEAGDSKRRTTTPTVNPAVELVNRTEP